MNDNGHDLDSDGYPTSEALDKIRDWEVRSFDDLHALWSFVESLWYYPDYFRVDGPGNWYVSTGGWSGNEDIIAALQHNYLFWSLCWVQSRRGGHHIFTLTLDDRFKLPEHDP